MAEKAIIRQGDPTTHGGRVLEGFLDNICMGKPIAGVGHKVFCPQCKGVFPIIEGARTVFMMGANVAVEGMKTACGAALIATQQTDTIEIGSAPSTSQQRQPNKKKENLAKSSAPAVGLGADRKTEPTAPQFDDKFILLDEDSGEPLANVEYATRRASGQIECGTTDSQGRTHLVSSTSQAEIIDIYV